jgi:4-amino-4-deoxychorismate lyase
LKGTREQGKGEQGSGGRLQDLLGVPDAFSQGLVRCNIFYDAVIRGIEFSAYIRKEIRSLRLVEDNTINYPLKFSDRQALLALFEQRGEADEIIIVKNGLLTDTSMSNLVFTDGQRWFTPATPLLRGTCRERLLAEGRIVERIIRQGDLEGFTGCRLINAMRDLDDGELIPVSGISR